MRRMIAFFGLAFGWTWAWQAPIVLGYEGPLFLVLLALAAIGPSLAAVVVTRGRIIAEARWSAAWWWCLVAFALPLAIGLFGLAFDVALGHDWPAPLLMVPMVGAMVLAPLGEELGWRGFAYSELAERLGRPRAAVLVGVVWGVWHLPTALWPGASLAMFPLFVVMVTLGGVWMAWLYEASGRSVTVAILAHAAINTGVLARGEGPGVMVVSAVVALGALTLLARPIRAASGARRLSPSEP